MHTRVRYHVRNFSNFCMKPCVNWMINRTFLVYKVFYVVRNFHPWDVMTKVHCFLMVQTYNLRTLEVEHNLETCSRPWSTWILTLWASQGSKNWNEALKSNILSSLHPMDENPGGHEQVFNLDKIKQLNVCPNLKDFILCVRKSDVMLLFP